MIYRLLLIAILLTAWIVVPGCKKQPAGPPEETPQVQQDNTPITEDNLDSKVDQMEQEIQEDSAAEE